MSLFRKKVVFVPKTTMVIGEFDLNAPGYYRNILEYPVEVKPGRDLFISLTTDAPVDVSVASTGRRIIQFAGGYKGGVIGPVPCDGKGLMEVILGVYAGDKANIELEIWME